MDPYKVWLSEIMLQQTTVATVISYFTKFVSIWPTVEALARAPQEDVLKEWAGLGYYARARNLHKCAQVIARLGAFPNTEAALLELPGIGPYTAAAIASIAFGQQATIVDGNVERVISRIFRVEAALPAAKAEIRAHAATLTPRVRPGDYAQAIMDLGATVCTPTSPDCGACPWRNACGACATGDVTRFPVKAAKTEKPVRYGTVWWLEHEDQVWLRRRPPTGLLGGMVELPTSEWHARRQAHEPPVDLTPVDLKWENVEGNVVHVFTHFRLELQVQRALLKKRRNMEDGFWHPVDKIDQAGLPTVFAKVAKLVNSLNGRLL
jgi:A/G-specific adenine glycosylase